MKQYNPELYYDLELNIMSCLLQRHELMKECVLEDKYFKKYQKLWKFMRIFYSKYKCFDMVLMVSVAKDRYNLIEYLSWLVQMEPAPSRFKTYQQRLIEMYNEANNEQVKINAIYELASELSIHKITLTDFELKVKKLLEVNDEGRTN